VALETEFGDESADLDVVVASRREERVEQFGKRPFVVHRTSRPTTVTTVLGSFDLVVR